MADGMLERENMEIPVKRAGSAEEPDAKRLNQEPDANCKASNNS